MKMLWQRFVLLCAVVSTASIIYADDIKQVEHWLLRMHSAAHTLNYTGTFIFQQGKQVTAMRIVHAVDAENGERERLVSQEAMGREVIRTPERVLAILPDSRTVLVERERPETEFPPEFPVVIEDLIRAYTVMLGKQERVAGRVAQKIIIKPKDNYRYGHRLWVDTQTGLLLKKQSLDEKNKQLELFKFTEIKFMAAIPNEMLEPSVSLEGFTWIENEPDADNVMSNTGWTARQLPPGFYEDNYRQHRMPASGSYVDHLIFTDGLVSVSVFIELLNEKNKKLNGVTRLGMVSGYGRRSDKFYIMTVGEVPPLTVKKISAAIYYDELMTRSDD